MKRLAVDEWNSSEFCTYVQMHVENDNNNIADKMVCFCIPFESRSLLVAADFALSKILIRKVCNNFN